MKTINIKKASFVFLIAFGLFNYSVIAKASGNNKINTVILEETNEPEMRIEPWMSNIDGFKQTCPNSYDQNKTFLLLKEEEETPIPIRGWMTDLSYQKYIPMQGKNFNSHFLNSAKYKLR